MAVGPEHAGRYGRGLLMGAADLVPGISGGTVALLLGIHPRLVAAIAAWDIHLPRDLLRAARGDQNAKLAIRRLDLGLVIPLLLGIVSAIIAGAAVVHWLIDNEPGVMMAFFLGLLVAAIPVPLRYASKVHIPALLIGAGIGLWFATASGIDWSLSWWGLALAGAIALTAMIMPGISGSGLLVLMGVYEPVLEAVRGLEFARIIPFGVGGVLGLAATSRILRRLFRTAPDATWSTLTGLLMGSIARVWPWRTDAGFAAGAMTWPSPTLATVLLVLAGAVGFLLVRVIDLAGLRRAA